MQTVGGVFDSLKKDSGVAECRWTVVAVVSMRGKVMTAPSRTLDKAEMRWVASRWQLADPLTKPRLADLAISLTRSSVTRLHELWAAAR